MGAWEVSEEKTREVTDALRRHPDGIWYQALVKELDGKVSPYTVWNALDVLKKSGRVETRPGRQGKKILTLSGTSKMMDEWVLAVVLDTRDHIAYLGDLVRQKILPREKAVRAVILLQRQMASLETRQLLLYLHERSRENEELDLPEVEFLAIIARMLTLAVFRLVSKIGVDKDEFARTILEANGKLLKGAQIANSLLGETPDRETERLLTRYEARLAQEAGDPRNARFLTMTHSQIESVFAKDIDDAI